MSPRSTNAVRPDHGGEFEGDLQRNSDQLGIKHQHTLPDIPKDNDVVKRWIRLLRENALLGDLEG